MIKPTKSVRSALADKWIPACSRMTDIEGEISYRPCFCSSSSRTRGPILKRANDGYRKWRNFLPPLLLLVIFMNAVIHLKREDICESIKPTKSVRSALADKWIPACEGMTDIESGKISYRPCFCSSSSRTRGPILKRKDVLSRLNRRKACVQRLLRNGFPPARE